MSRGGVIIRVFSAVFWSLMVLRVALGHDLHPLTVAGACFIVAADCVIELLEEHERRLRVRLFERWRAGR